MQHEDRAPILWPSACTRGELLPCCGPGGPQDPHGSLRLEEKCSAKPGSRVPVGLLVHDAAISSCRQNSVKLAAEELLSTQHL
eukprot:9119524-Pyramimonas_sp.AAC.1